MDRLYPLVLEPIFKYRIWGGRRLEKILAKKLPPGQPVGESWEVSCRNEDNSVIRNGESAGKTLADIFASSKEALVGSSLPKVQSDLAEAQSRPGETPSMKFPLLNKFIDANDLLSVQAHPDERTAAEFPGAEAKTEAWYIIHADPGATLVKGLKPGVTAESFEEAIRNDSVPSLVNTFPVSAGDMVFVPAGCVHAMGKGLVVCEIQQNSDTTFRVYDWGRVGPDGKPRRLHIEQALRAINFQERSPDKVQPVDTAEGKNKRVYLVACRYFAMELLTIEEPAQETTRGQRFDSLMTVSGAAVIRSARADKVNISAGDSVLMPACIGDYEIAPVGRCTLLKIYVPDIKLDIEDKLRARGIAEHAIHGIIF